MAQEITQSEQDETHPSNDENDEAEEINATIIKKVKEYRTFRQKFDESRGLKKWWYGIILVIVEFLDDMCNVQAAAISYFAIFSIFPLILSIIAVGTVFFEGEEIRNQIINVITGIPELERSGIDIKALVNGFLDYMNRNRGFLAILFVLVAIWSGTSIFDGIMNAANVVFEVRGDKRNFFYKVWLRFVMLFGIGSVLLLAQIISLAINILENFDFFSIRLRDFRLLFALANLITPILLVWLALVILFRIAPDYRPIKARALYFGAFVTALGIQLAKFLFGLYINAFNGANGYAITYGALAGIFIFIFYIYINAMILLFGLEIVAVVSGVEKYNTIEKGYTHMTVTFKPPELNKPKDTSQTNRFKDLYGKIKAKPKSEPAPQEQSNSGNEFTE